MQNLFRLFTSFKSKFPQYVLFETRKHLWQPAENSFCQIPELKWNREISKPLALFVWTPTKRNVLTNLSKIFPQKSENLLLTMQNVN